MTTPNKPDARAGLQPRVSRDGERKGVRNRFLTERAGLASCENGS